MVKRPCFKCKRPSDDTWCPDHKRDRNLPTRELPRLLKGPRICSLCGRPITEPRGTTAGAPSVHHLDGDVTNNHPSNLSLTHMGCNAADAGFNQQR